MVKYSFLLLAFVLFFSCKKDDTTTLTDTQVDQKIAEENYLSENFSDDVSQMSDEAYRENKLTTRDQTGGNSILADTVKITRNAADSSITIDFGTTGILCRDQRVRKGSITIKFSNGYRSQNATVTQTFTNYSVNGHQFSNSSTRSITYKGLDSSNNPYWEISANLTITKANSGGKTFTWQSSRTRTMIAGGSTPLNWTDDVYRITGSASGVTTTGHSYTLTITKGLLVKIGCPHIQEGILSFTRGTRTIIIDYGYGSTSSSCDGQAEITLPDGTKTIINL